MAKKVRFEHANGVVNELNEEIAIRMEKKKQGKILGMAEKQIPATKDKK